MIGALFCFGVVKRSSPTISSVVESIPVVVDACVDVGPAGDASPFGVVGFLSSPSCFSISSGSSGIIEADAVGCSVVAAVAGANFVGEVLMGDLLEKELGVSGEEFGAADDVDFKIDTSAALGGLDDGGAIVVEISVDVNVGEELGSPWTSF